MAKPNEIDTVEALFEKFDELGSLLANLAVYDANNGTEYTIVKVYVADDDSNVVCLDIEKAVS